MIKSMSVKFSYKEYLSIGRDKDYLVSESWNKKNGLCHQQLRIDMQLINLKHKNRVEIIEQDNLEILTKKERKGKKASIEEGLYHWWNHYVSVLNH
uniref:Transposase n=1 Tax=Heterorhabditis bacteriophora TaxID=37862 RepID=A0A1I7WF20_HETBA